MTNKNSKIREPQRAQRAQRERAKSEVLRRTPNGGNKFECGYARF